MTMREAELKIADELERVAKILRKEDEVEATKEQARECLFALSTKLHTILTQVN